MLVVWDEKKRVANLDKHGLDFAEFASAFAFEHFGAVSAKPGVDGRRRFLFVGRWRGEDIVAAVVAPLGSEALSLISLRPASRKERETYARL